MAKSAAQLLYGSVLVHEKFRTRESPAPCKIVGSNSSTCLLGHTRFSEKKPGVRKQVRDHTGVEQYF